MAITSKNVADRMGAYLHHQLTLEELVNWAENQMMEGEFAPDDAEAARDVVARLGLADVRAFGLTWEDCERLLDCLGYSTKVDIVAS
jgi:hypothetical protein